MSLTISTAFRSRSFLTMGGLFGSSATEEDCCPDNAATELLWHALGGTDASVEELLNISPTWSRMYRDDITIMVVFFKEDDN